MLLEGVVLDCALLARLATCRLLMTAWIFAVGAACASASDDSGARGADGSDPCVGALCGAEADAGGEQTTVAVLIDDDEPSREGGLTTSVLCGQGCVPDDRLAVACSSEEGNGETPPGSGGGGTGGAGAQIPDAAPTVDAMSPTLGCYVVHQEGAPVSVCEPAGTGLAGALCRSVADCAPGFGCVGDTLGAGQCRRYCCTGVESCEQPGTYCAERPVYDDAETEAGVEPLRVPVCVAGDNCSLLAPYPCSSEQSDLCCPDGTACTVVRSDGTVACTFPGTGTAGDACPCASGYVCSDSSGTCLRLCQTTSNAEQCDQGHCQSNSALPDGFGVCTLEGTQ